MARGFEEFDAFFEHCLVGRIKVADFKEEADPPSGLLANRPGLLWPISLCKKKRRLSARRRDADPTFARASWRVFQQMEAEGADIESNRLIIVRHDKRDL